MGLFDKMFGSGAGVAEGQPNTQQQFDQLKQKYSSVLRMIEQSQEIRLRNLHVENNKLVIRGTVPSDQAKNQVWDQIKLVDPTYSDLMADFTVDPSTARQSSAGAGAGAGQVQSGGQTYTVQSGDTLSKISRQFYGDANDYMHIFNANRDKLSDPNKIQVGQVLTIPPQ